MLRQSCGKQKIQKDTQVSYPRAPNIHTVKLSVRLNSVLETFPVDTINSIQQCLWTHAEHLQTYPEYVQVIFNRMVKRRNLKLYFV